MKQFIKYFQNGMRNFIVVGVPDFSVNNSHEDYDNIKSDFIYV